MSEENIKSVQFGTGTICRRKLDIYKVTDQTSSKYVVKYELKRGVKLIDSGQVDCKDLLEACRVFNTFAETFNTDKEIII